MSSAKKDLEELRDSTQTLQEDFSVFVKRKFILWCIRWIIGFAIIGLVTWIFPGWGWLWIAGLVTAAVSLTIFIMGHVLIRRKTARIDNRLAEAAALTDDRNDDDDDDLDDDEEFDDDNDDFGEQDDDADDFDEDDDDDEDRDEMLKQKR